MAGLLDFLATPEAALGVGLLGAASSGRGFGGGLMDAVNYANGVKRQAQQDSLAEQYKNAQIAELERKSRSDAQKQALIGSLFGGAPSQGGSATGGGASPQMPSGGGISGMTLDQIAALKTMGIDLTDQWKLGQTGVPMDAGKYYRGPSGLGYMPELDKGMTIDSRTGAVSNLPGYVQANAQAQGAQTAAQEAAKYGYTVGADRERQLTQAQLDPVNVVGNDGNTYAVPRSQVVGGAGRGAGGPGGGGFMTQRNPVTTGASQKLNDNWVTNTYQPVLDAGSTASQRLESINALRNIDLKTGWGTEAKGAAANMLAGLGVDVGNAKMFASNMQKFQSVAMDNLQKELALQKGPQTEGDAQRAQKTFVSLANTPDANQFIMDFAQAQANQRMRKAAFYQDAQPIALRNGGDLTQVDRRWQKYSQSIWDDPIMARWKKQ